MREIKVALTLLTVFLVIFIAFYYWHRTTLAKLLAILAKKSAPKTSTTKPCEGSPMKHMALNEIYKDNTEDDSFEMENSKRAQMLNTPGCRIPVAMVNYTIDSKRTRGSCGRRAVFLKKVSEDKLKVSIHHKKLHLKKGANYSCCYGFFQQSQHLHKHSELKYTKCTNLRHGETILIDSDFLFVNCYEHHKENTSHKIYQDVFAFVKKIYKMKPQNTCQIKYNVIMIGMDSMSLPRFAQTLPRTIKLFQDKFWLGFRGYHKVGDNTFPNLMAAFTGRNASYISKECTGKMDQCNDLFIWSEYKKAGYVTAYGEDYLRLPDTFSNKHGFHKIPTDHYMRPFFRHGETEVNNKSLVCAGKIASGQQLLNFALDFALTYRNDSFFGVFWMNSFSHNINSHPEDADKMLENFFNQLEYTRTNKNTLIVFFSDHGIRFGEHRFQIESYFDERMPILFLRIPIKLKGKYPEQFRNLANNQFRLVTPFDLYNTLMQIKELSTCKNISDAIYSEGCLKCHNLLKDVDVNRTCQDVNIHGKWCSCRKLYPLDVQDTEAMKYVLTVVSYIKNMTRSVITKKCWGCLKISLKKIIRIHFYYEEHTSTLTYVVAFTMTPGNVSYEANVVRNAGKRELIGPISVISPYRGLGKCTVNTGDRLFCVCQQIANCSLN